LEYFPSQQFCLSFEGGPLAIRRFNVFAGMLVGVTACVGFSRMAAAAVIYPSNDGFEAPDLTGTSYDYSLRGQLDV
jgi:hypothetical protein